MKLPISVKAVIARESRVVLLKNDRNEWELPGGRLEAGEDLRECVRREVREEAGLRVEVGPLLDARIFEVVPGKSVLVVSFGCRADGFDGLLLSEEHKEVEVFLVDELGRMPLPDVYRGAIRLYVGVIS